MKIIYVLILTAIVQSCQGQKNTPDNQVKEDWTTTNKQTQSIQEDTIMIDKENVQIEYYDFQTSQNGTQSIAYEKGNGWLVEIRAMKNMKSGASKEYSPASDFYLIYKEYYLNGMIKERGKFMSDVAFGKREYFDEQGHCLKIVDEDKKFGTIKREDIIQLLEREGWFNRQTGENIITKENPLPTNYTFYREIIRYMDITLKREVKDDKGNEIEPPKWFIDINPRHNMHIIRYIIDGNTGKFEKKETFEPKDE